MPLMPGVSFIDDKAEFVDADKIRLKNEQRDVAWYGSTLTFRLEGREHVISPSPASDRINILRLKPAVEKYDGWKKIRITVVE